jgi:hypothetical protein
LRSHNGNGFGIFVNQTIWGLSKDNMAHLLEDKAEEKLSTTICAEMFEQFTYVSSTFSAQAYLARVNSTSSLYIIDPSNRKKW